MNHAHGFFNGTKRTAQRTVVSVSAVKGHIIWLGEYIGSNARANCQQQDNVRQSPTNF